MRCPKCEKIMKSDVTNECYVCIDINCDGEIKWGGEKNDEW